MNENPITITIENYKGKKLTFTASSEAAIHLWKTKSVSGKNKGKLIETKIYFLADDGIEEKEEKYNG
jgi:hypothetical protein